MDTQALKRTQKNNLMYRAKQKSARSTCDADRVIGDNIRKLRLDKTSLSQAQLGQKVGVTFQQIQKYERGANRISMSRGVELCEALGCSYGDLLEGTANAIGRNQRTDDPIHKLIASGGGVRLAKAWNALPDNVSRNFLHTIEAIAETHTGR